MPTFVPFTSDDEILKIGRGLMDRTLPKVEWTHAAHFAVTIWLLTNNAKIHVAQELPCAIRAYNEATGVANTDTSGYHETITQASIRGAESFVSQSRRQPLVAICNALMASPLGSPKWLLTYWSHSRLFSVEARRVWLDPDVKALPF